MSTQDRPRAGGGRETELAIVRRAYAKHVLANADVDDARVEEVTEPQASARASASPPLVAGDPAQW